MTEETTGAAALETLRSRIREAWADGPLYIDEIVAPGLTANQVAAIEYASAETTKSGLPHFIAVVSEVPPRSTEDWARFTSDLAYSVHETGDAEQSLVLFSQAAGGANTQAFLVDDNCPAIPRESAALARSASGDFLPIELEVPHQLAILVAAAQGGEPPAPPDFDTRDAGDRNED